MDTQVSSSAVVIVGGGLAGLTAACYLARAGQAVTLVEQAAHGGGAAATHYSAGFAFNRGLHALYPGGAASAVLRDLGVTYQAGTPTDLWVLHQDTLHPLPADPMALLRSAVLPLRDKLELLRLFTALSRLSPATLAHLSVQEWLSQAVPRPQANALLRALARTFVYSTALDLVSANLFVAKLQRTLHYPVQYIHGGWQTVVDGLRRVAAQAGAQIVTGTRVAAVIHDAGRAAGVRLRDGSVLFADSVVLAVRPADALTLVDVVAAPALHRAVARLVPARVACLDVALERLPNPQHPIVQDLDGPRFLSAQSVVARVAPPGGAFVGLLKQLDARQPFDAAADERDLEALLDRVQAGWRDLLVKRVFLPHIVASNALPTVQNGGFAGRPHPQVAELDQLYLAGDWIGAEGFLADASFASARQAAQLVLQAGSQRTHTPPIQAREVVYG